MSKRRSKIAKSEEDPGEGKVKKRKFAKLLNTDLKDLEIADSLRRLGNIQVMEWNFRSSKRVVEATTTGPLAKSSKKRLRARDLKALTDRLKNFLRYVAENLIDDPTHAQIEVSEISPTVLHLKLLLVKRDLAMLVGRGGDTAEAIRRVLKAIGRVNGVDVLLQILSHEEDASLPKSDAKK
ncbi:MAG: KH domain-containing protein [Verrucomicrobiota bacterium]